MRQPCETPDRGSLLLDVQELNVSFATGEGSFYAVHNLSFSIQSGESLCLVGESGCGKTMAQLAILGLTPPGARIQGKHILFHGSNLLGLPQEDLRRLRGKDISMIFQEPMSALNPVLRIGDQAIEGLTTHLGLSKKEAMEQMGWLFEQVGIADARQRLSDYPHHLSGGMRQRVMIAMAFSCNPSLLLADEPTTALDVTIQGQILSLLHQQTKERGMGLLLITHDLGVVAEMADKVGVMYAGELVELAPVEKFFHQSLHPYAAALRRSLPEVRSMSRENRLQAIPGSVPPPGARPQGCPFRPRCSLAMERCSLPPPFFAADAGHFVRCWRQETP